MRKPHLFLFDLDGTLCELGDSARPYNHSGEEVPIRSGLWVISGMLSVFGKYKQEHFRVGILTGRKRKEYEQVTKQWLVDYLGVDEDEILLFMQEGSQGEKNHIYKEKKLIELKDQYYITALVDDNEDMVEVCAKLGVPLYLFRNC